MSAWWDRTACNCDNISAKISRIDRNKKHPTPALPARQTKAKRICGKLQRNNARGGLNQYLLKIPEKIKVLPLMDF